MTSLPLNRKCLLLKLLFACHVIFVCKFVVSVNIIYFYLKYFHFHYITHHSVSKTALSFSCFQNIMVCYTVTMEKVQIFVSDGMCVEPLSKMYTIQLIYFLVKIDYQKAPSPFYSCVYGQICLD